MPIDEIEELEKVGKLTAARMRLVKAQHEALQSPTLDNVTEVDDSWIAYDALVRSTALQSALKVLEKRHFVPFDPYEGGCMDGYNEAVDDMRAALLELIKGDV